MKHLTILLSCISLLASAPADASIWRVNNQGYSANYSGATALQDAIDDVDNVLSGDTLHVEASPLNYGSITLPRALVLIGPGYFLSENSPVQANAVTARMNSIVLAAGAEGASIAGLDCGYGGSGYGVTVQAGHVSITRCYVNGSTGGVRFNHDNLQTIANVLISGNYIEGRLVCGTNAGPIVDLLVQNNFIGSELQLNPNVQGVVAHNVANDVQVHDIQVFNNIIPDGEMAQNNNSEANVYNNIFGVTLPAWLTGSNNALEISMANVFTPSPSPDAALMTLPGCVVCANGFGGATIGMYGGATPYALSGLPPVPTIYHLQSSATSLEGGTLDVSIGTRSNN